MNQKQMVFKALSSGREMTSKQLTARFAIASPRKVVSRLRLDHGLNITSSKHINAKGETTYKYSLGKLSRKAAAAADRLLQGVA